MEQQYLMVMVWAAISEKHLIGPFCRWMHHNNSLSSTFWRWVFAWSTHAPIGQILTLYQDGASAHTNEHMRFFKQAFSKQTDSLATQKPRSHFVWQCPLGYSEALRALAKANFFRPLLLLDFRYWMARCSENSCAHFRLLQLCVELRGLEIDPYDWTVLSL